MIEALRSALITARSILTVGLYVECGVSVKSILKVLPEPHTVEAKRLHTFVL